MKEKKSKLSKEQKQLIFVAILGGVAGFGSGALLFSKDFGLLRNNSLFDEKDLFMQKIGECIWYGCDFAQKSANENAIGTLSWDENTSMEIMINTIHKPGEFTGWDMFS